MSLREDLGGVSPPFGSHRFDAPLLIYGAGGAGRSVAQYLMSQGIEVLGFIDAGAKEGDVRDELPVTTLSNWLSRRSPEGIEILVALHNPFADVAPVIDELRSSGFRHVLSMVDYVNSIKDPTYRYWLAPAEFYRDKWSQIEAAFELFPEPLSRKWFESCLRLRLLGDYHGLPRPTFEDQYAPLNVPRWSDPMSLIDCGAYVGDSVRSLLSAGYRIESVIAFEPDLTNYGILVGQFSDLKATLLPCGVSDAARRVSFSFGEGPSSRVKIDDGGDQIQCVAIDQAFPGFKPNLIKMDIEGSELDALRGAERTIRNCGPGLAISVYHEPEHLWEIPLFVASLDARYKMFLRGHGHNDYDLVLYCTL